MPGGYTNKGKNGRYGRETRTKAMKATFYPDGAADVPVQAMRVPRAKKATQLRYVPPKAVTDPEDVETVLCQVMETLAVGLAEGAERIREVLSKQYISVEDAVALAEMRGRSTRRPKATNRILDREFVRPTFARLVALDYDGAVALLDAYGASHFNEIEDTDLDRFEHSMKDKLEELRNEGEVL